MLQPLKYAIRSDLPTDEEAERAYNAVYFTRHSEGFPSWEAKADLAIGLANIRCLRRLGVDESSILGFIDAAIAIHKEDVNPGGEETFSALVTRLKAVLASV